MIPWIVVWLGIFTAAAGSVALLCVMWALVLGWVERLMKRTFYTYGAWNMLREFKAWKAEREAKG